MARAQNDTGPQISPKAGLKTGSEAGFASLGPTLLARKGGAKPAMRSQLAPLPGVSSPDLVLASTEQLEDLGWNDMGDASAQEGPAPKKLAKRAKKSPQSKRSKPAKKEAQQPARKAAFTLRLDADRHLKLRLVATMHGKSAQALVTEAIDAVFGDIEDLDALAKRMKRN